MGAEVSPAARALARQVLLHEAGGRPEPAALAEAADRAYARLHGRLAGLMGQTGYTLLVARAVRLAQAEEPVLVGVTVDAWAEDGLRGAGAFALATRDDPGAAADGLAAILARIIGLLVTFIGEDLALRLVREAWPELAAGQDAAEGRA